MADFTKRVVCQEPKVALHQFPRHAIAASCKRMLTVKELGELFPHDLVVGVVRRIDVHPAFEPGWRNVEEDRGLFAALWVLHIEEIGVLRIQIFKRLHNDVRDRPLFQTALDVVGHGLDTILVQGLQSGDEHLAQALGAETLQGSLALQVHATCLFVHVHLSSRRHCLAALCTPVVNLALPAAAVLPAFPASLALVMSITSLSICVHGSRHSLAAHAN
mmetsp:Transcript_22064/g.41579  ORF Transcript_22064/g.41579 Transcript_22064/m.41579 type:complete len:218 (-) Transcript_22064:632-1285(-)